MLAHKFNLSLRNPVALFVCRLHLLKTHCPLDLEQYIEYMSRRIASMIGKDTMELIRLASMGDLVEDLSRQLLRAKA